MTVQQWKKTCLPVGFSRPTTAAAAAAHGGSEHHLPAFPPDLTFGLQPLRCSHREQIQHNFVLIQSILNVQYMYFKYWIPLQ